MQAAVATILSKVLSDFIEDIDADSLKIGFSDTIELGKLKLKPAVFDMVGVPFNLKYGYVGEVQVKIPWFNLMTEPLEITIGQVFALLEPKPEGEWDATKS
jgi:vacuolar protein sorting-associated protein 13A/C